MKSAYTRSFKDAGELEVVGCKIGLIWWLEFKFNKIPIDIKAVKKEEIYITI
jgi:hypothetical protein